MGGGGRASGLTKSRFWGPWTTDGMQDVGGVAWIDNVDWR